MHVGCMWTRKNVNYIETHINHRNGHLIVVAVLCELSITEI